MNTHNQLKNRHQTTHAERTGYYSVGSAADMTSYVSVDYPNLYKKWRIKKDEMQGMAETSRGDTEPSAELQRQCMLAKDFVANETGYDLSAVDIYNTKLDEGNGMQAGYNILRDVIQVFNYSEVDTDNPAYVYEKELAMEVLVHELMHATGSGTLEGANIRGKKSPRNGAVKMGHTTFDMRKSAVDEFMAYEKDDIRLGQFFEEAFAEEGVARWREHVLGPLEGVMTFTREGAHSLPHRFITLPADCGVESAKIKRAIPAYAAAGLYFISDYTGVDIYALQLEAREPVHQAQARRQIIGAIESVEKGLYAKLRDADYSEEGFSDAYVEILAAIQSDIAKKTALGKIATAE